ncbi:MAG: hypothetical protein ABJN98_24005 [Roseibium sp.]|uniref:hypothetical protein n=1 Tax=Roseibium polysiphoniae TaxID=2571221 RepID=UPI0032993CA3
MDTTKSIFRSKTFWGAIVAILASVIGLFGIEFSATDQAEVLGLYDQVLAAWESIAIIGGSALAIYGRISATAKIG